MEQAQEESSDDIQRRILQNTLDEVAAREEDAADCCVICLDVITEPCEALPCGHRNFDYICVSSWLFERPQCPLCKAKVLKVVHGPPDALITTFLEPKSSTSVAGTTPDISRTLGRINHRYRGGLGRRGQRERHFNNRGRSTTSDIIAIRRDVYRYHRYSKHVGSNRLSRYRELTPQMFCTDVELVSRARMWIRRELRVFSFLNNADDDDQDDIGGAAQLPRTRCTSTAHSRRANNAEFLLEYIIAILKSVDIMGSCGQAEDLLSDFLGREDTKLFLHELRAWLRSPFTKLEDWDGAVQYAPDTERAASRPEMARRGGHDEAEGLRRDRRDAKGRTFRPQGDSYRPRWRSDAAHGSDRWRDGERSRRRSRSPRRAA